MTTAPPEPAQRPRGRPRHFDIARAQAQALALFEARGYDRVSLADMTQAMGINPPSFYAAFTSKSVLFAAVLDGYATPWLAELRTAFALERPVAQVLIDILQLAAHRFAAPGRDSRDARRGGCLILEAGLNCSDPLVADRIRKARLALAAVLYRGISRERPEEAPMLTDYMMLQLTGLSALAREGVEVERLLAAARLAGVALPTAGQ